MPAAIPAAIVGSAAIGAIASKSAADKAAKAQTSAANQATDTQMRMFETLQENLAPYREGGGEALDMLLEKLPGLTTPIPFEMMDQEALEQTPGYQFARKQGLKAVQNSAAARGLGVSGASLKGAAEYATGLADQTFQNQFSNYQQLLQNKIAQQQATYDRLMGLAGIGQNSAANVGSGAISTGQSIGENITGAANARAGAYLHGGNAIASGVNNAAGGLMANQFLNQNQGGLYQTSGPNAGLPFGAREVQGTPWR